MTEAPLIPYGRQWVDEDDRAAVAAVLAGDWLTQGPTVERFEVAVAHSVGARHAVSFSSATAGLHAACAAGDLGTGDFVVTSPLTFIASANCARYVGADIGVVDIDARTWNTDPTLVPAVDALIAVHYAGLPMDLTRLAHRPRVVIEDASHALGAVTPDGPVGNCAHSDMCVFSFHPVKPITSGEGGMVTTNDDRLADRLRAFRSHGIIRDPARGGWVYDAASLGFNYRLTDIQAALGLSQLRRLEEFTQRRGELADRYRTALADLPVELPPSAPAGARHSYHLFAVRVGSRRQVYDRLRLAGIGVQVHYVPVHHHSVTPRLRPGWDSAPTCDEVYSGLLSLPLFPLLSNVEQDRVIDALATAVTDPVD